MRNRIEAFPETGAVYAGARQYLLVNEFMQNSGDLKSVASGTCGMCSHAETSRVVIVKDK